MSQLLSGRRLRRPAIFYGWWIVAGAFTANMVGGGVSYWSFGIYVEPLEHRFGWTRAEVSGAISLAFLAQGLTGPLVGRWVDRHGARSGIFTGSLLAALCYFLLAEISELWHFYALQVAVAVCRSWTSYIPVNALISRWFVRRRATALGISSAGFMSAGVVFVPVLTLWVERFGWRTAYMLSGLLLLLVYVPFAAFLARNQPEDLNLKPDGGTGARVGGPAVQARHRGPELSFGSAVRTLRFWLLSAAFALFFMGFTSFQVHAVPFYLHSGLGPEAAGLLVAASAAITTALRLTLGLLLDRLENTRLLMVLVNCTQAAALTLIVFTTAPWALALFIVAWAGVGGFGPLLESLMLGRSFGLTSFGALLGMMGLIETFSLLFGPWVGGYLFDKTGAYDAALLLYVGAFLVSAALFLLLPLADRSVVQMRSP